MKTDAFGLLTFARELDKDRYLVVSDSLRLDSARTQGRTTRDVEHTESFSVPSLGGQDSGVQTCPGYNER